MDPDIGWWIGVVVGCLGGIVGGVIGTYFPLKNAKGPRERAFVLKYCVIAWILIMAFVMAMFLIPTWHKHLLWIPYTVLLFFGIRLWNRAQLRIQKEESGDAQH